MEKLRIRCPCCDSIFEECPEIKIILDKTKRRKSPSTSPSEGTELSFKVPSQSTDKPCPNAEFHCPKCKDTAKPRKIGDSIVYDCNGCGDQIAESAIESWIAKGNAHL